MEVLKQARENLSQYQARKLDALKCDTSVERTARPPAPEPLTSSLSPKALIDPHSSWTLWAAAASTVCRCFGGALLRLRA